MPCQPAGHVEVIGPRLQCVTAVTQGSHCLLEGSGRVISLACLFSFSDEKLYDAYVLYPKYQRESQGHDVDTLVLKILPEVLEKQCGYKLFIFGRDEFPGQGMF